MDPNASSAGRVARCPVCGVDVVTDPQECPACHTPYHADCWSWLSGCAIYGCSHQAAGESGGARPTERPPEADLPAPAGPHDLVLDTPLQNEAFGGEETPLPTPVRGLYFAFFAFLFPKFPIPAVILAGLPFMVTRVRWKIDPQLEKAEGVWSIAGVPVHRRTIPLSEVVRLEVQSSGRTPGLQMILHDGSHVALTHDVPGNRKAIRKLLSVARGVAVHTPIHLTSSLRRDPVTTRKRLESLKALVSLNTAKLERAANVAHATLLMMMIGIVLATPVWISATTVMMGLLGGGLAASWHYKHEKRPFGKHLRDGWITERGVDRAELALRDRFPTEAGQKVGLASQLSLVMVSLYLAGFHSQLAMIALLWAAVGAVFTSVDFAKAQNVQRLLQGVELEEPPPEPIMLESPRRG